MNQIKKFCPLLLIILVSSFSKVNAQFIPFQSGQFKHLAADTLYDYTGCGRPASQPLSYKRVVRFYDSCNHKEYDWQPEYVKWIQLDSLIASTGGGGNYHLPYNGDSSYYLGGDSVLHRLPYGDSALTFPDYLDSTLNPQGRNLASDGQGHIYSSPKWLFDSAHSVVALGFKNISTYGLGTKFKVNGNARFNGDVIATSFSVPGGTSSQFLKADGSIDPNTYLTSYTETDPLALLKVNNLSDVTDATTALNNILPSQTGNSGKVLQTNGSSASWQTVSGGTGSTNVYAPLIKSGDTISQRYNVLHYGATGDGRYDTSGTATASSSTFTSAHAVFNASTDVGKVIVIIGAGTSGQDFVGTISAVASSTSITLSAAASTSVSNARFLFGTDQTASIQAAINDCWIHGGGIVWIPKGIYVIAGGLQTIGGIAQNCQLYIPHITSNASADSLAGISIHGEGIPKLGRYGIYTTNEGYTGTVLVSTLTSGSSGAAVIGTKAVNNGFGNFNANVNSIRNISIRVLDNPGGAGAVVGGISLKYGSDCDLKNISVMNIGQASTSVAPTNDVVGIETPDNSSGQIYTIKNVIVGGFRTGFRIGEHVLVEQAEAMVCYRAFDFKTGHHAVVGQRLGSYWCTNDIYFSGAVPVYINEMDDEWYYDSGFLGAKWFSNLYTINDSLNQGHGIINYYLVKATVGVDNSHFSINGNGNKLILGSLDSTGFAVKKFANTFTGQNKFTNYTRFFDNIYVHGKVGIGDSSFNNDVSLIYNNSGVSYRGVQIQNTNAAGQTGITLMADNGKKAAITVYGSIWGFNPGYRNYLGIASDSAMVFSTGGSAIASMQIASGSPGAVTIGNYQLPTAAPTSGQYLGYSSSGVASWSTPANYWSLSGNSIYNNNSNGNATIGGATTAAFTSLQSGWNALPKNGLELKSATSGNFANLAFITDQSSTSGNIGTIVFGNTASGSSDKRMFVTQVKNDDATNSARAGYYIANAGTLTEALDIFHTGNIVINGSSDDASNKLQLYGNLALKTAGNKINIATGTNASVGTGTLSSGTVTINTTAVTASSLIILTYNGGSAGNVPSLGVSSKTAGTSFTVVSSNASDSGTFSWVIIN